jgi:hypothetical protein
MVKPVGDYHPPEGWVEFSTLKSGEKFHNIVGPGMPTQYVKLMATRLEMSEFEPFNAVNTDTGDQVFIDPGEFVYPIF